MKCNVGNQMSPEWRAIDRGDTVLIRKEPEQCNIESYSRFIYQPTKGSNFINLQSDEVYSRTLKVKVLKRYLNFVHATDFSGNNSVLIIMAENIECKLEKSEVRKE